MRFFLDAIHTARSLYIIGPLAFLCWILVGCSGELEKNQYTMDNSSSTSSDSGSQILLVPTPTAQSMASYPPYSDITRSLDHLIFLSDTIILVRPPSITAKAITVPSDPGVAPTYRPTIEFEFQTINYLKGTGSASVAVDAPGKHTYLTEAEALKDANGRLESRNTTWDDRDAVIFLRADETSASGLSKDVQHYYFASPEPFDRPYSIDSSNKVWMPAANPVSGQTAGSERTFLADPNPIAGVTKLTNMSLSDLRSRIEAINEVLRKGKDTPGLEKCLNQKFGYEAMLRRFREVEGKPYVPKMLDYPIAPGLARGGEIKSVITDTYSSSGVERHWLEGPNIDLFRIVYLDSKGKEFVPDFGYKDPSVEAKSPSAFTISWQIARPLAGRVL